MLARIGCLGLSHHDAPVAVREALCLSPAAQDSLYERAADLRGFALLSTCNRLEFYIEREVGDSRSLQTAINGLLPPNHGSYLAAARSYVYEYTGLDAARHLACVAAGLDSMVLGEPQIQGQVQECFRQSTSRGHASPLLSALFQTALKAGGRVRQESALARNPVSVASVAVELVRRLIGPLVVPRIAIIGAGMMGRLVAKILCSAGVTRLLVVNRTEASAAKLAESMGAQARPMAELDEVLCEVDVVFCTARGQGVLLGHRHLQGRQIPLLIVDLAVPRNVDTSVQRIAGVRLFDIDSLREEADTSLALRRAEVPQAEAIVDEEVEALEGRVRALAVEPVIRNLRLKADTIRQEELARALKGMNGLGADDVARLRHFSQALVNKLLHEPTTRLRELASTSDAGPETDLIRALFAL